MDHKWTRTAKREFVTRYASRPNVCLQKRLQRSSAEFFSPRKLFPRGPQRKLPNRNACLKGLWGIPFPKKKLSHRPLPTDGLRGCSACQKSKCSADSFTNNAGLANWHSAPLTANFCPKKSMKKRPGDSIHHHWTTTEPGNKMDRGQRCDGLAWLELWHLGKTKLRHRTASRPGARGDKKQAAPSHVFAQSGQPQAQQISASQRHGLRHQGFGKAMCSD
jgi:hypothetical protein